MDIKIGKNYSFKKSKTGIDTLLKNGEKVEVLKIREGRNDLMMYGCKVAIVNSLERSWVNPQLITFNELIELEG